MSKNTSEQEDDNHIELFLEAMSQLNNVFEGIKQQDSLPMTREERDRLNGERLNYCDYNYILMGAFVEGFSCGMGMHQRYAPIPKEIWNKGQTVYDSLMKPPTHPMTQEERNQFADKWLERRVYDKTQLGALKHGIAEGRAEGRVEGILEIAKKMKAKGQPTDFIADITGLTIEEIEKL